MSEAKKEFLNCNLIKNIVIAASSVVYINPHIYLTDSIKYKVPNKLHCKASISNKTILLTKGKGKVKDTKFDYFIAVTPLT